VASHSGYQAQAPVGAKENLGREAQDCEAQSIMQPVYDLSWILPYVRESLRGRGNFNFDDYMNGLWAVLERANVKSIEKLPIHQTHSGRQYNFDNAHPDLQMAATEAFYYLEQNRFTLRPAPNSNMAFMSHGRYVITARGQEWANGVDPLPEDYNGYMKQFDATVDPVVRQYVSEALNTYIRGTFFASAVMIGAASEKTVYMVADALVPTLQDAAKQQTLKKRLSDRKLDPLFTFIERVVIDGHTQKVIPYEVMEGTTRHLMSLIDYIKVQRNDAVHPMTFQVSADSVRFSLNAFPLAFKKVEALRQWCLGHPSSL
jgi:hypothetical protein